MFLSRIDVVAPTWEVLFQTVGGSLGLSIRWRDCRSAFRHGDQAPGASTILHWLSIGSKEGSKIGTPSAVFGPLACRSLREDLARQCLSKIFVPAFSAWTLFPNARCESTQSRENRFILCVCIKQIHWLYQIIYLCESIRNVFLYCDAVCICFLWAV